MNTSSNRSIFGILKFLCFVFIVNTAYSQNERSLELFNSGKEAFKKNKFKSADSLFTLSLNISQQADAYFNRALSRQKLKDTKGSCMDLWNAYYLGHNEAKIYFNESCAVMDTLFKDARLVKTDTNSYVYKEITETCSIIKSFDYAKYNKKGELLLSCYGIDEDTIYRRGSEITLATFSSGSIEYKKYLSTNLVYPPIAKEKKLSGRVWVSFVVAKDGSIEKTMLFKPMKNCDACNQEALRLASSMPKWKAATRNNKAIKNNLRVAIDFKLK
jgi:TonB family protein